MSRDMPACASSEAETLEQETLVPLDCPVCGEKDYTILYAATLPLGSRTTHLYNFSESQRRHAQIVRCIRCGVVYCNPVHSRKHLTLEEYRELDVDDMYLRTEPFRKMTFRGDQRLFARYMQPGRMLDVGCYAGFSLEVAQEFGWKATGVEAARWAVDCARGRGLDVVEGGLADLSGRPGAIFDLIVLNQVIEHVVHPKECLKLIDNYLAPQGWLYLTMPFADSLAFRLLGEKWWCINSEHVVYYTNSSIKRLLASSGFEVMALGNKVFYYPLSYVTTFLENNRWLSSFARLLSVVLSVSAGLPVTVWDTRYVLARKM